MTIDWIRLIAALVLLLTPASLFYGDKIRYRDITHDWERNWMRILSHGLHLIDLVRSVLGVWLLLEAFHGYANARGVARYYVLFARGGIELLAVLVQTGACRAHGSVNAPYAFVSGLLLADLSPLSTLLAVVLAAAVTAGVRASGAFFPLLAIAHVGLGGLVGGPPMLISLIPGGVAVTIPLLWSALFNRDLVVAYRAKRTDDERLPPPR